MFRFKLVVDCVYPNGNDRLLRHCGTPKVTIIAMIMITVAYGMYCRFGPRRKPYEFFLCHHKAGAGAFARLLKISLKDTRQLKVVSNSAFHFRHVPQTPGRVR
eukprot:339708-Amphidinium_carterae.1